MFGGSITKFSRSAAAVADYVPDTVNWTDVSYDEGSDTYTYSKQRITSISSSILIKPVKTAGTASVDLYYKVTGTNDTYSGDPSSNGFTKIDSGNTFSVSNNQYVHFSVKKNIGIVTGSNTYSIKNNSDSDTQLDTIQISYLFEI